MKIKILAFILFLLPSLLIKAQTSPQLNAAEIKQAIKKSQVVGSVLYFAAHPDDENTRLLAYLAQERKVRTGYLSLTRGDGGQNLIGNEQAELLGLIRTQELLAARKVDGAEQFFSRAIDFGFSKSSDEALKLWGREQILEDAVWIIRKFQPDVIITRFPEDARAGHGQHAASAIIAHEAFKAAADPKRFPDQLKHVKPWQAKRLLWNTYNFGTNNTTSPEQLKLDVGVYNALLGKGYGEIAAESRSNHKSQGFGAAKSRGQQIEFFSLTEGDAAKADLFEGINLSWSRMKGGEKIGKMLAEVDKSFNIDQPSHSVSALLAVLTEVEKLEDSYWRSQKEKELKDLISSCAGLWFESYASEANYAISDSIKLSHQVIVRSDSPVTLKDIKSDKKTLELNTPLQPHIMETREQTVIANQLSQPYWLSEKSSTGSFSISDPLLVGYPENPDPVSSIFTFTINGKNITYTRPVVYKFTDPVRGEIYQPLAIEPPVTITPEQKIFFFKNKTPQILRVRVTAQKDNVTGTIGVTSNSSLVVNETAVPFNLKDKGDISYVDLKITPAANSNLNEIKEGHVFAEVNKKRYLLDGKTISYEHIPLISYFPPANFKFISTDLQTNGKHIGYLPGAGDRIPDALRLVGYTVDILSEEQIAKDNLSVYDAIVTGVRVYNINSNIKNIQPRLLEYVQNGGNLLVQYNVNNSLQTTAIGPYPFRVSNSRVTDENSKVTFLNPSHPILNYPNKITQEDFKDWVQERGLYFASDIDSNYTPILSMNDSGEPENKGSLIVAKYGKGKYVYTSLSFFRQLPAGVPGAYRLFVNLIAKNINHEK